MLSKKNKLIISSFLLCSLMVFFLNGEETRFQQDMLIFSNGGGLENKTDQLQSLDIGKGGVYLSKGVQVFGKYISIDTEVKSSLPYSISDTMKLSDFENSALAHDYGDYTNTKLDPDSNAVNIDTYRLLLGDASYKYMLFKEDQIVPMKVSSSNPRIHDIDFMYFQKNKAPTYFGNVTPSTPGQKYKAAMSAYGQLVVGGALSDVKRVGINTNDPSETLTIVGDFVVSGKTNAKTGVFRPTKTAGETNTKITVEPINSSWKTAYSNTVKVKYVDFNALAHGYAVVKDSSYLSTVSARIHILKNGVDYITSSVVQFEGSPNQRQFTLYPVWTGVLTANTVNPETEVTYTINLELSGLRGNHQTTDGGDLYITALPNTAIAAPVVGSVSDASVYSKDRVFDLSHSSGNFISPDTIVFNGGGVLVDSDVGLSLIKNDGVNFKKFKATKLTADEIREMQVLKIFGISGGKSSSQSGNDYLKIANNTNYLSLDVNTKVNGDTVTHSINAVSGASPTKLKLPTANFSNGAIQMSNYHVGFGQAADTTAMLAVAGNISFTGSYGGNYGYTTSNTLNTNSNVSIGTTWTTVLGTTFTLPGTTDDKYNCIVLGLASFQTQLGPGNSNLLSMKIDVNDDNASTASSYRATAENDHSRLFNIWTGELSGNTSYTYRVKVMQSNNFTTVIRNDAGGSYAQQNGDGAVSVLMAIPKGN